MAGRVSGERFRDSLPRTRGAASPARVLQKIAPDEPRTWFTERDLGTVLAALDDPEIRADGDRRERLAMAFGSVPGLVDSQPCQMNPDQMHRFMDALKEADPGIYAAVLSKVRDLDPRFGGTPTP